MLYLASDWQKHLQFPNCSTSLWNLPHEIQLVKWNGTDQQWKCVESDVSCTFSTGTSQLCTADRNATALCLLPSPNSATFVDTSLGMRQEGVEEGKSMFPGQTKFCLNTYTHIFMQRHLTGECQQNKASCQPWSLSQPEINRSAVSQPISMQVIKYANIQDTVSQQSLCSNSNAI